MIDPNIVYENILALLKEHGVAHVLYSHRSALTYEELAAVQKETGFFGTEAKCLVMKSDDRFVVYITLQGKKVNFDRVKEVLGVRKIKLATPEELRTYFGAEPGCAYPFGFSVDVPIYIDPVIFDQKWLLFSPALSTHTIQAKGSDLRKVFDNIKNEVTIVTDFNQ